MFRQLMLHFGFFGLVLVMVYWINRAVAVFDQLIANGERLGVFIELSLLMLPTMIASILPIAVFVAAVFVTNRLSAESELVAAQAAGCGPFRLARPVLAYGLVAGIFVAGLGHFLVPMSLERLAQRQAEIAQNITARFLTEGTFVHPTDGITIYLREITREGEMHDIFLSDTRNPERRITYTAKKAFLLRSETGPLLVMIEGQAQVLETDGQRLTVTGFDDFTYDLSALIATDLFTPRQTSHLFTPDLMRAPPALLAETGATRAQFLAEAHLRNSRALLTVAAALSGFSFLLAGGFSRFGLWRQIILAVVAIALITSLDNAMVGVARSSDGAWPLVYLGSVLGFALNGAILYRTGRSRRPARTGRPGGFAGKGGGVAA